MKVPTDSAFHNGDRIRFEITSKKGGYLYIVQRGSGGNWDALFPSIAINGGNNKVTSFEPYQVPGGSEAGSFHVKGPPGVESIFILLRNEPQVDLDRLIMQGRQNSNAASVITDDVIQEIADRINRRDLVFSTDSDENVYVANTRVSPDAEVVIELKLRHNQTIYPR